MCSVPLFAHVNHQREVKSEGPATFPRARGHEGMQKAGGMVVFCRRIEF